MKPFQKKIMQTLGFCIKLADKAFAFMLKPEGISKHDSTQIVLTQYPQFEY